MKSDRSTLIAEVYDLRTPVGRSYPVVEYYQCLLTRLGGRILELASGTGRVLIPLREAGLEVDGLDFSPEMLSVCRRYCRARGLDPALYDADMRTFEVPEPYDVIIIPAGAIKELDGRDAALGALRRCRDALAPGGRLVVDVVPPRPVQPWPLLHWKRDADSWTLQTVRLDYDSSANRTTMFLRYEKWHDGTLVTTELHQFCLQHWTLWEFKTLLAEAGFIDVHVTADYQDGNPPGPDNDDWTFHATKM